MTGPEKYRIPNRLQHDTVPVYYDSLPIKSIGDKAGVFYRDYVNFNEDQYYNIRSTGSSVLTKALTMPLEELKHLITWAANGKTLDQICEKVDSFVVPDLHWAMDATYAMGSINIYLSGYILNIESPVYTEKSGESMAQRSMYSGQKKWHLTKCHIHCSTRGRIIAASGLWPATLNDAAIFKSEIQSKSYIKPFIDKFRTEYKRQAVVLADRGYRSKTILNHVFFDKLTVFRDCRELVHGLGWNLEYPEIQQSAPVFGDKDSQAPVGSQNSKNLSQLSVNDSSQDSSQSQNSMFKRYLATKPFDMYKADRSRLVSARRHVIGKCSSVIKYLKP